MGGLQKKTLNLFNYFYSAEHMVAAAAARAASVRLKGLNIVFNGCYYYLQITFVEVEQPLNN